MSNNKITEMMIATNEDFKEWYNNERYDINYKL